MPPHRVLIYVLRRDLRVADNPIFHEISNLSQGSNPRFTHVLPIYIVAAQQIEVSGFLSSSQDRSPFPEARSQVGGFWRCGPHRAKFLAESVWDVKTDLEKLGSGLVIRVGMVGQVVKELLGAFKQNEDIEPIGVWMTSEEAVEEKREEQEVRGITEAEGKEFRLWTDEKYYIDDRDLPFDDPKDLPDVFTTFRKQVEPLREGPRSVLPVLENLPPLPPSVPDQPAPFSIPTSLEALISCLQNPLIEKPLLPDPPRFPEPTKSAHDFQGGSKAGHARVHHVLVTGNASSYKDTRNGLLGQDFSTKFSAWLALGCITARQIHHSILRFENGEDSQYRDLSGYGAGENAGTAAIRFELLWRDYMRLCARKFGPRLFRISGFRNDNSYAWRSPSNPQGNPPEEINRTLTRFLRGETGTSFIDAAQLELFHTGYTSNRARQNVASFLAKRLKLDWRLGAEWYESLLTDYDVSSNWGNWQYVAGVGNDPRGEARVFNPIKQGFDYDPKGDYVKAWIPKLRDIEDVMVVFQPFLMSQEEKQRLLVNKDAGKNSGRGLKWLDEPLVRIDFRPGGKRGPRKGRGGGGGGGGGGRADAGAGNGEGSGHHSRRGPGRYGGSSRYQDIGAEEATEGSKRRDWRGGKVQRGGRGRGPRDGPEGGGRADRKGDMDKFREMES